MSQTAEPASPSEGAAVVNAAFAGTGAVVVAGVAGALAPDTFAIVTVVVSLALFAIGVAGLLYGYGVGVARSREEVITLAGLFWLVGTAPRVVRFRLRLAFIVQVTLAFVVAALRPYTSVAFISLAPMFGLGVLAVWAARHGAFLPKEP